MKLFSESTNSLKKENKENNVDPNYTGEDLPFLIAETVRTSMEVDGFIHRIDAEADEYIMESAEEEGIDLNDDGEEAKGLIMEAAFGDGGDKGIIQKVINFIKKMYRKVADFVKGILGRFQNVEKLWDETVAEYTKVEQKMRGKSIPSGSEIKFKEMAVSEGMDIAQDLFDVGELFTLEVKGTTYSKLSQSVNTITSANQPDSSITNLKDGVQDLVSELGGNNNEAAQHKLMVKYFKELVSKNGGNEVTLSGDDISEDNTDKDPKNALMKAVFTNETDTISGGTITQTFNSFSKEITDAKKNSMRKNITDGKEDFENRTDEVDEAAKELQNMVESAKNSEDDKLSTQQITDLTSGLNNYSTVVGIYTAVSTNVYTFAVKFIQEYLNRAKKFAGDVENVVESEATEE